MHIAALGPPQVRLDKHLVIFPTRKTFALLIYLALEEGMQSREVLAALLWPESNPERSHANLRNTLGHLRTTLGRAGGQNLAPYLSITHQALGLNSDAKIDFDLQTVARAYELARADRSNRALPDEAASQSLLQAAVDCLRGDFLAGFSLGDAPGFDDWAATQREVWRRRLGLILDRLSEIQFARGEFAAATETCSRWIALDSFNEIAYRRKMRSHFAAGERGQALQTYEICHTVLKAELGIEPGPDTAALAERIRKLPPPVQPHRSETSVAFLGNLFAGRTNEYQTLMNSYERATTGQPQFVVLHGEAGIGKTRLARKFLVWTSTQGAELLQGVAFESGSHLPFQPLVDALRLRLEHKNALQELLNDIWLSPLSQLLPELRQRYPRLSPPPLVSLHSEIDVNQEQFYEPIVQYTLALAEQTPVVLFMDDLQWADSATLDLLLYAVRRWRDHSARILLLICLRSEALYPMTQPRQSGGSMGLAQWLTRVTRASTPVHIELEPLGERETVQMVQAILSPPVADFAQWLYDETRGQPFYLMETLKDLLERQVLHPKRRGEGQWTFELDAEHDLGQAVRVPSTVHAVIRSRLNRLSPQAFSLLVGGAVLEQQITFERLCVISNVTQDLALPALDELISGRFLLESVRPGLASTYALVNDMLREVVYTEAGDARRRLFHRRALEILAAVGESAAVLAHHAQAAGLVQAAFRHSLAAGHEALRILAVSEAIVHLELALQFVQKGVLPKMSADADLRDLYTQLGRAYELSGQKEKALAIAGERDRLG